MSTDLREKQRRSTTLEGMVLPPAQRTPRWPYVATAIVLAVLVAVSVLVFTQDDRSGTFPDLNTQIREGSGYAQVGEPGTFSDLNTAIREGSGHSSVDEPGTFPDLMTEAREGGS